MAEFRAAVIGLGILGRRMVGNLLRHPRFTLSGAWDPAAAARKAAAKEFSEVPIMGDAKSLITSAETDLVYIACPPQWHKEYALAAIFFLMVFKPYF